MELKNMLLDGVTIFRMAYGVVFQNGLAPESFNDAGAVSEDYSDGYETGISDVDTVNGGSDQPAPLGDEDTLYADSGESPDVDTPSSDGALPIENEQESF